MDLKGQVLAADGVQKVKADGKLGAEPGIDLFAQQLPGVCQDQVHGRQFENPVAKVQKQGVLLRDAVETPGIIGLAFVEAADFFHPLSAPDAGIKIGNSAERAPGEPPQGIANGRARHHFRLAGAVGVNKIIDLVEPAHFVLVGDPPFDEISPLEFAKYIFVEVGAVVIGHAPAVAELDLPAGHVQIEAEVRTADGIVHDGSGCSDWQSGTVFSLSASPVYDGSGCSGWQSGAVFSLSASPVLAGSGWQSGMSLNRRRHQKGAESVDNTQALRCLHIFPHPGQPARIHEVLEFPEEHSSEDTVVSEMIFQLLRQFFFSTENSPHIKKAAAGKPFQGFKNFIITDSGIGVYGDQEITFFTALIFLSDPAYDGVITCQKLTVMCLHICGRIFLVAAHFCSPDLGTVEKQTICLS